MKTFWVSRQVNLDGNHTAFVKEPDDFDGAEDDYWFFEYYQDDDCNEFADLIQELADMDELDLQQLVSWRLRTNAVLTKLKIIVPAD